MAVSSKITPSMLTAGQNAETSFISGIDTNGNVASTSFNNWNYSNPAGYRSSSYSRKWGGNTAGSSGGTVSYYFDPSAKWTATEKTGFAETLALWSDVANISFVETTNASNAGLTFKRGTDQSAYEYDNARGEAVGSSSINTLSSATISVDTSIYGWNSLGSFTAAGGYNMETLVHETGHALGLGHAGAYNGNVNPATQQFSNYDTRQWTLMSYIEPQDTRAKYLSTYTSTGTKWNGNDPTTFMPLDIVAIQQLYGLPVSTPLSGGQTFGFNCNVAGLSKSFFDFTVNSSPVVTLWDAGTGNTLDLSGFTQGRATINLNPGTYSSCAGMTNNIAIAFGTAIDTLVLGGSNNTITSNGNGDTFKTTLANLNGDTFKNFSATDTIYITDATLAGLTTSYANGVLTVKSGTTATVNFTSLNSGTFAAKADASGKGVDITYLSTAPTVTIASVGGLVNKASQTITGSVDVANAGSTVYLYDNGGTTAIGSAVVGSTGVWSAGVTLNGQGAHAITAADSNLTGTGKSLAVTYTLDTNAPVVAFTSRSQATNSLTQIVSGTVGAADAGVTILLYDNNGSTPIGTAVAKTDGTWSTSLTLATTGSHTLVAKATDRAGNLGTSGALIYTVDTTAPTIAITSSGGITNKAQQTISGKVGTEDAGTLVSLYDNNGTTAIATALVAANGTWSASVLLKGDGSHTIVAQDSDAAGNRGTSAPIAFSLNTATPAVTLSTAKTLTNQSTVTLTGTVDKANPNSSLAIFDNGASTPLATALVNANGIWTANVALPTQGINALVAVATNSAGTKGFSQALNVRLDTIAPIVAFSTVSQTVKVAAQTLSGTVGIADAGTTVSVYDNGATKALGTAVVGANGTWSMAVTLPNQSVNVLVAKVVDAAGNIGSSASITETYNPQVASHIADSFGHYDPYNIITPGVNATVSGTDGHDRFVFTHDFGTDRINDFAASGAKHDQIALEVGAFSSMADILRHTTMSGSDAVINVSATDKIVLTDVSKADLKAHPNDFRFYL